MSQVDSMGIQFTIKLSSSNQISEMINLTATLTTATPTTATHVAS